jgi:hypothetical protein
MKTSQRQYKPIPVTSSDVTAFGGKASEILPRMSEIPEEFHRSNHPWCRWQQQWFFKGLDSVPVAKPGVDSRMAMANLACVQGSWEPKHEHKEAGVAYLASLWFDLPEEFK